MCDGRTIEENRQLRQQLTDLKAAYDALTAAPGTTPDFNEYVRWVRQEVGPIPLMGVAFETVEVELRHIGIEWMATKKADTHLYYTDEYHLAKMVPFVTFSAEYYVGQYQIDCDDYAKWGAGMISLLFHVNCAFEAYGTMPLGRHAFCIARVGPDQYRLWEPNAGFECAGEPFNIGDNEYQPDKWK